MLTHLLRREPHPSSRLLAAAGLLTFTIAQAGCSLWQENVTAQYRHRAEQIEPLLQEAGFQRLPANTAAQRAELGSLKPLTISRSVDNKGTRYWFADPYVCGCMYGGNEAAYQRFLEVAQLEENNTQKAVGKRLNLQAFYQVNAAPEINMFNPVFAP
jgi:hypothetical protein